MKKILFIIPLLALLFSCSSDDSSKETEVETNPTYVEWIPTTFSLNNGTTALFSDSYPHAENCNKDFIRVLNSNSAIFFEHEHGSCAITETVQPWNRSGNQISLVLFDTPVTGTVISETNAIMVIESDASQYSNLISLLYPELSGYINLLTGLKVQLTLNKK